MLLATNGMLTWSLAFDQDDASLFVLRTVNQIPNLQGRMTVDDFLGSVPRDETHAAGIACLTLDLYVRGAIGRSWRQHGATEVLLQAMPGYGPFELTRR